MDTLNLDDANERPTLPDLTMMRSFDTPAESFFSSTVTLRGATAAPVTESDEIAEWWVDQRRRSLFGWVAAVVALSAGVLVAGLLAAPV